jgi:hypothetical protein
MFIDAKEAAGQGIRRVDERGGMENFDNGTHIKRPNARYHGEKLP